MYACQTLVVTKERAQPVGTITLVNARTISLGKAARLLGEASAFIPNQNFEGVQILSSQNETFIHM